MQISNIEKTADPFNDNVVVTFENDQGNDFLVITLSKNDLWQLVHFAMKKMSYRALLS